MAGWGSSRLAIVTIPMRLLIRFLLLVLAGVLTGCSDGPAGSGETGKKPSLSKGADEFMKVYGGVESGVTETPKKESEQAKPEEKK